MIGFIKGTLIFKNRNSLVVETGNVGYELFVPNTLLASCEKGSLISLWVYTNFKQDSLELYGFSNQKEKELFLSLLKVKGIGPKMALQVLSSCSLDNFVKMIKEENIKALRALPKIGKKMAQQIVLSLKDHVSDVLIGSQSQNPYEEQLFYSLEKLGFQSSEIREVMKKMEWKKDLKKDLQQSLALLKLST
ncbi:MAG: Holliday junction branch migration protein RuvA [Bdellovibrionaceae bacterium]|nr:Holliday junction branch migration protein RuvA [Pseudobdellovibrionaceae bacterium]